MQLETLPDEFLLSETQRLVKIERSILSSLLHHLREIDRRRLYSALGYPSLFAYCIRCLGYPEDQASRRINAMRMLKTFPELEGKVADGALSLTSLSLANSAFKRMDNIDRKEQLNLLAAIENKSSRDTERLLAAVAPLPPAPDRIRTLNHDTVELRFEADARLRGKIDTLRELMAHKHPQLSLGELFEKICDLAIQSMDESNPSPAAPRVSKRKSRRAVWKKAKGRCEKCGSQRALQIDHIHPKGLGGTSKPDNLRLLCRSCNQRAAIEAYGIDKMNPYINQSKKGLPEPPPKT